MNLVLIGYRGTGKSLVGDIVAGRLGLERVGMDEEIVKRAGRSIPEIVESEGWSGFRDRESAVAADLAGRDRLVIDTGGGVIERQENVETLGRNAVVVWLRASVETIVSRIAGDTQRPSLTGGKSFTEEVEEVLAARTPKYRGAARHVIDTDGLSPGKVAERIIEIWRESE